MESYCHFRAKFLYESFEPISNSYQSVYDDIVSRIDEDKLSEYMEDNNWESDARNDAIEYFLYDEYSLSVDQNGIIEFDTLNDEIEELIGDNMVKLYHFTSSKFEKNIKNQGLVTGLKKTNPHANSYSGIYLTTRTTGNEIEGYKYHIRKHKADVILITVKMFLDELSPDTDDIDIASGKTQFISDDISPDRIISIQSVA